MATAKKLEFNAECLQSGIGITVSKRVPESTVAELLIYQEQLKAVIQPLMEKRSSSEMVVKPQYGWLSVSCRVYGEFPEQYEELEKMLEQYGIKLK